MGKEPELREFISEQDEIKAVGEWIKLTCEGDIRPSEVGVFVRGTGQMERAQAAVTESGYPCVILDDKLTSNFGSVNVATMHLAKGMEFRAVAVMACDDQVIPSSERIALVGDAGDLKEAYETERHLLYVACTRARDRLWISGVTPTSEFLSDMS
jgi:superfamily I DNA/RNA helicase